MTFVFFIYWEERWVGLKSLEILSLSVVFALRNILRGNFTRIIIKLIERKYARQLVTFVIF
jgi:hypothetical protein